MLATTDKTDQRLANAQLTGECSALHRGRQDVCDLGISQACVAVSLATRLPATRFSGVMGMPNIAARRSPFDVADSVVCLVPILVVDHVAWRRPWSQKSESDQVMHVSSRFCSVPQPHHGVAGRQGCLHESARPGRIPVAGQSFDAATVRNGVDAVEPVDIPPYFALEHSSHFMRVRT